MLKKLPAVFCLIYAYNHCFSIRCYKCEYNLKYYRKCKLNINNMIEFCSDKLCCENCNLQEDYDCLASKILDKFKELKTGSEIK